MVGSITLAQPATAGNVDAGGWSWSVWLKVIAAFVVMFAGILGQNEAITWIIRVPAALRAFQCLVVRGWLRVDFDPNRVVAGNMLLGSLYLLIALASGFLGPWIGDAIYGCCAAAPAVLMETVLGLK